MTTANLTILCFCGFLQQRPSARPVALVLQILGNATSCKALSMKSIEITKPYSIEFYKQKLTENPETVTTYEYLLNILSLHGTSPDATVYNPG